MEAEIATLFANRGQPMEALLFGYSDQQLAIIHDLSAAASPGGKQKLSS